MFSTGFLPYPSKLPPVASATPSSATVPSRPPPTEPAGTNTLPDLLAGAARATPAAATGVSAFALPTRVLALTPSQANLAARAQLTAQAVRKELLPCVVNQRGLTSYAAIRAYAHQRSNRTSAEGRNAQLVTPAGVERMVATGAGRCHENAVLAMVTAMINGLVPPGATVHRIAASWMDHAYARIDYADGSSVVVDPWLQKPFGGSLHAYPHMQADDECLFTIHHHADGMNLATVSAPRLGLQPTSQPWAALCNAYQLAIDQGLQARPGHPVWKAMAEGDVATPEQDAATRAEYAIYNM